MFCEPNQLVFEVSGFFSDSNSETNSIVLPISIVVSHCRCVNLIVIYYKRNHKMDWIYYFFVLPFEVEVICFVFIRILHVSQLAKLFFNDFKKMNQLFGCLFFHCMLRFFICVSHLFDSIQTIVQLERLTNVECKLICEAFFVCISISS